MSATSPNIPVPVHQPSRWEATGTRWQPAFSTILMFVLLAGLIGFAYTGLDRRDDEPTPTAAGLIAQGTPETVKPCEPYGPPVRPSSELRDMSLSDWPPPRYSPLVRADPAIGRWAVEVYESWLCFAARYGQDVSVAPVPIELQQFQTERSQYVSMLQQNPGFRSDEMVSILDYPLAEELMTKGVLPLNRPEMEIDYLALGVSVPTFGPSDVYQLSDGRYGVIMGTITTDQLVASQQITPIDSDNAPDPTWLTFLAFEEVDGWLLIDEHVAFCVAPGIEDDSSACQ